ncbi:MAG: hypothetical protein JWM65_339 [Sphingomonas bacterium]|nr:hypothetical protein [Sphingomonas bacterium]
MTHYYFNVLDGVRIDDEEGQELADDEAAHAEAVRSARSMMADAVWTGRLPLDESIEIVAHGEVVAVVAFSDAVTLPN